MSAHTTKRLLLECHSYRAERTKPVGTLLAAERQLRKALGRVPAGQKEGGTGRGGWEKMKTEKTGRSVLVSI